MGDEHVAYADGIMPQKRKEKRIRETVQVQLDTAKPDERHILLVANELKPLRAFKETFMCALEIVAGLERGDFNPLLHWYGSQLAAYVNAQLDNRFKNIEAHMAALQRQIDEMNGDRERMGLHRVEIPQPPPMPAFVVQKPEVEPSVNFLKALGIKNDRKD